MIWTQGKLKIYIVPVTCTSCLDLARINSRFMTSDINALVNISEMGERVQNQDIVWLYITVH